MKKIPFWALQTLFFKARWRTHFTRRFNFIDTTRIRSRTKIFSCFKNQIWTIFAGFRNFTAARYFSDFSKSAKMVQIWFWKRENTLVRFLILMVFLKLKRRLKWVHQRDLKNRASSAQKGLFFISRWGTHFTRRSNFFSTTSFTSRT